MTEYQDHPTEDRHASVLILLVPSKCKPGTKKALA